MRAVYVIVYCSHCHTAIGCYIEGLESLGQKCKGCAGDFCHSFSVDVAISTLCHDCNWCMEDCYGHA